MQISTTFDLDGAGDKSAMGEKIAAEVRGCIEAKFGGDGNAAGQGLIVDRLNVAVTAVERSRFELTVFTDDPKTNNDFDLADRLVETAGRIRDGAVRGRIRGTGGVVGHFATVYADDLEAEPAYTVIGVYIDGDDLHGRYSTTVYTHNGPAAAEVLAQDACREINDHDRDEDLLEIAAVISGEVEVVA
jgi:hypothetical protein